MKLSVVIPTRGDQNMHNIIACFESQIYLSNRQAFRDFEVIFVVDRIVQSTEYKVQNKESTDTVSCSLLTVNFMTLDNGVTVHFLTNLNSNLIPNTHNASYIRNFGIEAAEGEFIQLMDDDERFPENYLEQSLELRFHYREELGRDFVLTPTLMYRKTGQIQNQGFVSFNFRFSRPIPQKLWDKEWDYIQMYSGNSLLAPARIFKKIQFDEKIDFVYEDLDFTYRIHKAHIPLIVLRDLKIYHMERDKTLLEMARVGHELQAYKKAKHRIVFVKKFATRIQKLQFYLLGFRGQPLRLIAKVLRLWKKGEKWKIIKAIWKGTVDGIKS